MFGKFFYRVQPFNCGDLLYAHCVPKNKYCRDKYAKFEVLKREVVLIPDSYLKHT